MPPSNKHIRMSTMPEADYTAPPVAPRHRSRSGPDLPIAFEGSPRIYSENQSTRQTTLLPESNRTEPTDRVVDDNPNWALESSAARTQPAALYSSNPNDSASSILSHLPKQPEIEQILSQVAPIFRIKIFQRAAEKKSSVFVTFKSPDKARLAAAFMKQNNLIFKDMKEPLDVEYPTQDISRNPPVFESDPNALPSLSKKARKQLAAANCIAYARSQEPIVVPDLVNALSIHGPCVAFLIKSGSPSTAFVKFDNPQACAAALAAKTAGVTLPRHKRVDIPLLVEEDYLRKYLAGVGDIKAITVAENITTVEFLTALGAAQAIVRFQTVPFQGSLCHVDYSPSLKVEEGSDTHENQVDGDQVSVYTTSECELSEKYSSKASKPVSSSDNLEIGVETISISSVDA
ncbi:hypothetical protein HDU91_006213 [Kappamyces sp. JEL0680]|nr:hypothetical protein HDU91_006213 [Kappamyces sp. JEL0680]